MRLHIIGIAGTDDARRVALADIAAALQWQQTEAQRILATAAEVRGQLLAPLVGLTDEGLDRIPAPGEWSVRQVLGHVLNVEHRYSLQTAYAAERTYSAEDLPMRIPDDRMPPAAPDSGPVGGLQDILGQLQATRERMLASLVGLRSEDLAAPAIWGRWSIDVRFRLHRFAAHDREHLAQIQKTLNAIDRHQTEAQMLLGQAEIARGALEGMLIGLPDELGARNPGDGLPRVQMLLAEAVAEEAAAVTSILKAMA